MRVIVCIFIIGSALCWCQVTWEIEHVDSSSRYSTYIFNALVLDQYNNPHLVFVDSGLRIVNYAVKYDSIWHIDIVDIGMSIYYGVSIAVDGMDKPHLCYCGRDTLLDRTYLLYAHKSNSIWNMDTVDTISGWLGNYFWDIPSSIDLDTSGLPGIAYVAWNVPDSIHYIKYAHYNGITWDTSVVEYDTIYTNQQKSPSDWSPSLKISNQNVPIIAFQQHFAPYCTLKIARYNIQNNQWDKTCLTPYSEASLPVSLALTTQDHPCIAHDAYGGLVYTWYNGVEWQSELVLGYALLNTRVALALDSNDEPHICYNAGAMLWWAGYCYKRNGSWHLCGRIDPVAMSWMSYTGIAIDSYDKPHVSFYKYDSIINKEYMAYAKGVFVSIREDEKYNVPLENIMQIFPTVFSGHLQLPKDKPYKIFDITGRQISTLNPAPGIYFIEVDGEIKQKVVKIR